MRARLSLPVVLPWAGSQLTGTTVDLSEAMRFDDVSASGGDRLRQRVFEALRAEGALAGR